MTVIQFIRLILRNINLLIFVPLIIAVTLFFTTKNSPDTYASSTSVYSGLASGYSVEEGDNAHTDLNAINIAFDNIINIIKSRETKEEVALRLLAKHLVLDQKADKSISAEHLARINELLPKQLQHELTVKGSIDETYDKLLKFKSKNENNLIYDLINNETEPYYSVHAINEITVNRVQLSDIIQLGFETDDPGICQDVLELISDVFIKNFKKIKTGETNNVTAYFERQTKLALERLNAAEERLKLFRIENKIINYVEQTKFISEKHENIIDERNKEKMELVAAEASITKITEKLGESYRLLKANNELLNLRTDLSAINKRILLANVDDKSEDYSKLSALTQKANQLKQDIDKKVEGIFSTSISKEGISHKDLAKMWVDNVLKADESKAKLSIYGQRMSEIESNYDIFAPLGSNISKMEREIDIAEKEYLSNLASLNASKMREQNLQIRSNLQVVDHAYYPVEPLPNKRKLVLVGGTLAGLILLLVVLIASEILDQSIKSVERAKKFTNLNVISGLPSMHAKNAYLKTSGTVEKLVKMATSKIYQYLRQKPKTDLPFVVSFVSTKAEEGKTFIAQELATYFQQLGKKILLVVPETSKVESAENFTVHSYSVSLDYMEFDSLNDVLGTQIDKTNYDIVLIEFPAFCEQKTPVGILNDCDLSILILNASRIWDEADKNAFEYFKDSYSKTTFCMMNKMAAYELEAFIGEIPMKRSFIRKLIKKWIRLDFKSKK